MWWWSVLRWPAFAPWRPCARRASTAPVALVGAEDHLPYDRPPLSKKVLAGEWEPDRIALRRDGGLDALGLDARLGVRAVRLDPAERTVHLSDGDALTYDALVIATGSEVRRLPGQPELDGLHMLRTLDDSLALRAALTNGSPRVVVVGAGFIGSEVASTAHGLGCAVTVVEALPVPLVRALGPEMGAACAALHRDNGVDVRLGVGVEGFDGRDRVEGVRLTDGTVLAADVVVVGVGVAPATGWLEGSGLELRDGIVCDASLAAGPPGVYAAGDVCRWPNELFGEEMRVEHWTNAAEQGAHAARAILAVAAGERPAPVRARAVLLERPVRPEAAVPGPGRAGRRGPGGPRLHRRRACRRARVRGSLRPRRAAPRGARPRPPQAGDGIPEAPGGPNHLGRCPRPRRGHILM